jgi:hypothetical protein
MKDSNRHLLRRLIRIFAVASLILGLWPGLVLTGTPVDQKVKEAFQAMQDVAGGRLPQIPMDAPDSFKETRHWQLRVGFPLRPFLAADSKHTMTGRTTGPIKATHTQENLSTMYADPGGAFYSAILIALAWGLFRISRNPVRHQLTTSSCTPVVKP